MTQDEIIEMAKQAHLGVTLTHDGEIGQFIEGANWTEELEAFAKLVAAKEREACAMACENVYTGEEACGDWPTPEMCAAAIRARSNSRGEA